MKFVALAIDRRVYRQLRFVVKRAEQDLIRRTEQSETLLRTALQALYAVQLEQPKVTPLHADDLWRTNYGQRA